MKAHRAILHRVTPWHRRPVIPHGTTTDKQCSTLPVMGARRNVWGVAACWSVRVVGDNSTAVSECVAGGASSRRAWVLRVSKSCDGACTYCLSCRGGLAPTLVDESTTCCHILFYIDLQIAEHLQWQSSGDCFVNSAPHLTSAEMCHIGARRRRDEW